MKGLAPHDRPREKLERAGPAALGDNELIALLLGSGIRGRSALGVAQEVLDRTGGVQGLLNVELDELRRVSGVGAPRAARLLAAIELGRRAVVSPGGARPKLSDPASSARYLMPLYAGHRVERFGVVLLDGKNRVIRTVILTVGTPEATIVEPREIFREAALASALAVVVFHNHPSGDPRPSEEDVNLTNRIKQAGQLMGIELADHIILGDGIWFSFPDSGPPVKLLYFDCFSGAAGDMILGALLDAGLPLPALKQALGSLGVNGWDVSADRVVKGGIAATKFSVHRQSSVLSPQSSAVDSPQSTVHSHDGDHRHHHHHHHHDDDHGHDQHHHHHRTLVEIKAAIDRSALSDAGKARAKGLFDRLADAEAAVHNMPVDQVHLHEVGEIDSIVDIVGTVFAFDWFAADRIVVSPINVGSGMVKTAHGVFPVPAPATLKLLGDAPVYGRAVGAELLTPTGALVLTSYASAFGPMPPMRVDRTGYGAGDRDLEGTPNVLRVVVGESAADAASTRVSVVECEIDDMNPQIFGVLMDRLHAAGALDVFYAAVQMKKNRPGTLVTIIARPENRAALVDLMFRESTTIGVRHSEMDRECLDRETVAIDTPLGTIRFKLARRAGQVLNAQPEFDDIARVAAERGLPIKEVQAIVTKAWLDRP